MWTTTIRPRFCETDALGHINNTVLPVWFLEAREPVIALFTPDPTRSDNGLAMVNMEIAFKAESMFGSPVTITTTIGRIGNSSLQVIQRAWQNGVLTAEGKAALVSFNTVTRKSQAITDNQRQQLQQHTETPQAAQPPA
ncbi:MAG: thioesterase family protein [Pseudomonadota bacterium]|jgi:acyl-CoA thioester hydrolase|uniref:acyl-CoA thioesterase n=1 Tax=Alcanivorax sp. TaxID=1872427 RepID=UPI0025B80AB2|nr:thioesterase family protein [Alcanivorax sp.]MED5238466.1 thioesterase family protein [Pseudomonadota bacterium]MEE3319637.1 thioesterase family protein [Pseudomonadota bacterium]